jgi:hypothetical protein
MPLMHIFFLSFPDKEPRCPLGFYLDGKCFNLVETVCQDNVVGKVRMEYDASNLSSEKLGDPMELPTAKEIQKASFIVKHLFVSLYASVLAAKDRAMSVSGHSLNSIPVTDIEIEFSIKVSGLGGITIWFKGRRISLMIDTLRGKQPNQNVVSLLLGNEQG